MRTQAIDSRMLWCARSRPSCVMAQVSSSSCMPAPLADGGVGTAIVSREWAGAPVSSPRAKVARSYERGAGCPLAFGLAGFFLLRLVRVHAASLVFLSKKAHANACEFFARLRGAMESAAWKA